MDPVVTNWRLTDKLAHRHKVSSTGQLSSSISFRLGKVMCAAFKSALSWILGIKNLAEPMSPASEGNIYTLPELLSLERPVHTMLHILYVNPMCRSVSYRILLLDALGARSQTGCMLRILYSGGLAVFMLLLPGSEALRS